MKKRIKSAVGVVILLFILGAAMAVHADSPAGKDTPDPREQTIRAQIVATIQHPCAQVITDNLAMDAADALMKSLNARLSSDGFGKFDHVCRDGYTMNFRLFKPATTPGKKYPLVMFYHGGYDTGSDNERPLTSGVCPRFWTLPEIQQQFPCYVVIPQMSDKIKGNWRPITTVEHKEICDLLLQTYSDIDPTRIYIVGHSTGGSQVYVELATYPDVYAAGLASDGTGDVADFPSIYVAHHVNLMMFCGGSKDPMNPARNGLVFEKNTAALGGKYTCISFPNLDHWHVENTFLSEPGVLDWLFAQRR